MTSNLLRFLDTLFGIEIKKVFLYVFRIFNVAIGLWNHEVCVSLFKFSHFCCLIEKYPVNQPEYPRSDAATWRGICLF
jgi:hypothetical protein